MPKPKLSLKIKNDIFNILKNESNAFGSHQDHDGVFNFINEVWNLKELPSQDSRFKDAHGDIFQHIINNDDWDYDYTFLERLKLLEEDQMFIRFLEAIFLPKNRESEDEIVKFLLLVNPYLEKDGFKLVITDYDGEIPVYTVHEKEKVDNKPDNIKLNDIPVYIEKTLTGVSTRLTSHTKPQLFPSFVLAFNDRWNDYGKKNTFALFFYNEEKDGFFIGEVKVMNSNDEIPTIDVLPNGTTVLDDNFCSLGQNKGYYINLKNHLGRSFESVLYALKDAAFFPEIHEKYERNNTFINSLIRYNDQERLLRVVKYEVYEYDLSNLYKFEYIFKPSYTKTPINVNFDFDKDSEMPNRIIALIGKNGTGKTQLLTSLPFNISRNNVECFSPKTPLFSKVIAVSYSIFDSLKIPTKTASFNYVYCGVRNEKGEMMTDRGLLLRFHNTWKSIEKQERINQWRNILLNFINKDIVDDFLVKKADNDITSSNNSYKVNIEKFSSIRSMLSSGQSIILYIVSEIVANIRFDSLILYDEPETHLHPNAITELMNTIYELVKTFQSFCIIATHSPLVIRELMSKNVFVVEREGNTPSVRRIGLESFGENLSILTEEVFGNKNVPKQYKKIIDGFVK